MANEYGVVAGWKQSFCIFKMEEPEHIYMLKKKASREGKVDNTAKGGD